MCLANELSGGVLLSTALVHLLVDSEEDFEGIVSHILCALRTGVFDNSLYRKFV